MPIIALPWGYGHQLTKGLADRTRNRILIQYFPVFQGLVAINVFAINLSHQGSRLLRTVLILFKSIREPAETNARKATFAPPDCFMPCSETSSSARPSNSRQCPTTALPVS